MPVRDHGSVIDAGGRILVVRDSATRTGVVQVRWVSPDGVSVLLVELDEAGLRRLLEILEALAGGKE